MWCSTECALPAWSRERPASPGEAIIDYLDAEEQQRAGEPVGPQMAEAVERMKLLPLRMKQVLGSALRNSKLLNS